MAMVFKQETLTGGVRGEQCDERFKLGYKKDQAPQGQVLEEDGYTYPFPFNVLPEQRAS